MSNENIRCFVGTDWQGAEESRDHDGHCYEYDSDTWDADDAARMAAERACDDNSPEWYRDELYVISIEPDGTERRFVVPGEAEWVWHSAQEVEV